MRNFSVTFSRETWFPNILLRHICVHMNVWDCVHVLQLVVWQGFYSKQTPDHNPDRCYITVFFSVGCTQMLILTSYLTYFGFYFPYRKLKGNLLLIIMADFAGEEIRISCSCYMFAGLPVVDVVVLPSPAPVLVREAVDLQKLLFTEAWNSSEVACVGQPAGEERGKDGRDEGGRKGERGEKL